MRSSVVSLLVAVCAMQVAVFGQVPAAPVSPTVTPPPAPPVVAPAPVVTPPAPAKPAAAAMPVRERERRVFVPFEDMEKVFKDGGRGVFLPYKEFLELWNELTLKREEEETEPPTGAVISKAEYKGRIEGDSAIIEANITVESFKKGWTEVKLLDGDAAIGEADTGKAVLKVESPGMKVLLPEKGVYPLRLKFYAPVVRNGSRQTVMVRLPRAGVSRLDLTVPGAGLEFELKPAAAFASTVVGGATELACVIGVAEGQEISWASGTQVAKMDPLILAQTSLDAAVGVGSISTQVGVLYRILRAPVAELRIGLPDTQEVLGVKGNAIREWRVEPAAAGRKILVVVPEKPLRDDYALNLSLEGPVKGLPAEVAVPEIEIVGASYARGQLTVKAEGQLDVTPKTMAEVTRTQAGAEGTGVVGVFRLLRQPWKLSLDVTEAKPQVEASSNTKVMIRREAASMSAQLSLQVRRVGIFEARIHLPAGWMVTDVSGPVDQWNVDAKATPPLLLVKFKQQTSGAINLTIKAKQTRAQPAEDATLPVLVMQDATRHEARMEVSVHSSLDPNTKELGDFQQEDVVNPNSGPNPLLPPIEDGPVAVAMQDATKLGFRYRDAAKPAVLSFKSRSSQVSVEVLSLLEVREQSTRHEWTLSFDVAYAATDRFILAVPKAVADELRFVDPAIKEINKTYKPAQAPKLPDIDNYTLWEVIMRSERSGAFTLTATHEKPTVIEPGKSVQVDLLQLHVPDAFQETGQVAILKADSLEIREPTVETLEQIDARELASALQRPGVSWAYKYRSLPVKLGFEVVKNSYFPVPQAMVTHADLTTAVASDGAQTTEALYWVKNNDLQFLVVKLPEGSRLVADVFVGQESQQPMRREGSEDLLVRLPSNGGSGDRAAVAVRLVFETPSAKAGEKLESAGSIKIVVPDLPNVGVLETRHRLYLPDSLHYTAFDGPLTQDVRSRGWARAKRLADVLVPAFGPQISTLDQSRWTEPPAVPAQLRGLYGVQVPQQGHLETLRRLGAPAAVTAHFRSAKMTFLYQGMAFLGALFLGLILWSASARKKLLYIALLGVGGVLATGLVRAANVPIAVAVIMAVGLIAGVWILKSLWPIVAGACTGVKEWRARRNRKPEPVKKATPPPSVPSAPPPATVASAPATPVVPPVEPVSADDLEFPDLNRAEEEGKDEAK
ncbi:MAG: hypothetical protein KDK97_07130 [Verrucomicrobiales bacterium]|nr:hypothetical protein [Verrucomicrobiales bacterium]